VITSVRKGEVRLVIKPADAPSDTARLIPAEVLQRTLTTVLHAIKTADKALHAQRKYRGQFFVSDLKMGSNEFALIEQRSFAAPISAVDLFGQMVGSVYRSEYERAAEYPKVAECIVSIGKAIDERFPAVAFFERETIPFDGFFAKQAIRLKNALHGPAERGGYFIGSSLTAIDGTLGDIDYRGATWKGHLVLPGPAGTQIECVFDKAKGEDAINPYGNKRVSIRGRAIYTGDSILPERMEVISVVEIPLAREAIDIRGTLKGYKHIGGKDGEGETIQ
jgi:hypothetical protein